MTGIQQSEGDPIRHDLQSRALRVAELCQQELDEGELFPQLLQQWVAAIGAVAGAIWQVDGSELTLSAELGLDPDQLAADGETERQHRQLLRQVALSSEPQAAPPLFHSDGDNPAANPTQYTLLIVPIARQRQSRRVVEVFHHSDMAEEVQVHALRYLQTTTIFVEQWLQRAQLRNEASQAIVLEEIGELSRRLHQQTRARKLAYVAVNEAARLVVADRVSLCIPRGNGWRVAAVSGLDEVNRRSNTIVRLQNLARAALKTGEPFWYDGSGESVAPQLREPLEAYVDESLSKRIGIVPLFRSPLIHSSTSDDGQPVPFTRRESGELVGGLIIEEFRCEQALSVTQDNTQRLVPHVASALTHAVDYDRVPGMPFWLLLGRWRWLLTRKTLPKLLLFVTLLAAVVGALGAVPAPFELHAPGTIQPQQRRGLYAETNGFVYQVHVEHGQAVKRGQPLVCLRNTNLTVELKHTLGQRDAVIEKLAAVQRARLDRRGSLSREEANQLAGEAKQLQKQQTNLDSQLRQLQARHDRLELTSPIDGIVVSWDVENRLRGLPVTPQDQLLEVADPQQAWQIELHMQEDDFGYVLDADAAQTEALQVTYFLNSHPEQIFSGTVRQIDTQASRHDEHGHTVKILVDVDEADIARVKPGTSVSAKINAGTQSVGFVWLHDVWEFAHRKVLFLF